MKTYKIIAATTLLITHISYAKDIQQIKINISQLMTKKIQITGNLIKATSFHDKTGNHILTVTTKSLPSRKKPTKERLERHELQAALYTKKLDSWSQEWKVSDVIDCPNLDSSAKFFESKISVTDINKDGINEITIPYSIFCGGGVDTQTIKVIMRTGNDKFAIQGESLITLPTGESFGGSMQYDATLDKKENATFKKHLINVWKSIYIQKYR